MEKRWGLSELSVISWVSAIEGCLAGFHCITIAHHEVEGTGCKITVQGS